MDDPDRPTWLELRDQALYAFYPAFVAGLACLFLKLRNSSQALAYVLFFTSILAVITMAFALFAHYVASRQESKTDDAE